MIRGLSTGDAEPVGVRLRRLREARALSQRELAGPGVPYAYISRIEAGTRRPSVKALRTLAPKLGVSPEYLETGSELRDVDARELRLAGTELAAQCCRRWVRVLRDAGRDADALDALERATDYAVRSRPTKARLDR